MSCDWLGWQGCIPQFWLLVWWFGVFFVCLNYLVVWGFFVVVIACLFVVLFWLISVVGFCSFGFFLLMSLAIVFPSQCSGG